MKRFLFFFLLLFATVALVAQVVPEPPTDWGEVILDPGKWFASFGAVAVLTAFVSSVVIGLLNVVKRFPKQLIAWLIGILLLLGSHFINFGYAADLPLKIVLLHGFAIGLAANGIFDIPLIKSILKTVEGWFGEK